MAFTDNINAFIGATGASATGTVTATATSNAIDLSLRNNICFQFIASAISAGNGVFTVDGSNDGTNWVTGLALQDATSTNSTTWVTSKTISSNTTSAVFIPLSAFRFYRVKVTVTTDGTYSSIIEASE